MVAAPGSAASLDAGLQTLLAELPPLAYGFVLVLSRIGSAMMLVPLVGEAEVPPTIRAAFTVLLVALLLPGLAPLLPATPGSPLLACADIAGEIAIGLWLGWLARLVVVALTMSGQFISLATGLSNVLQPDPALGTQNAALARLMTVAAPVALLSSGLYLFPLAALAGSYQILPAGAPLPASAGVAEIVAATGRSFALAVRLATPFLALSLLWHLVVALAGRLAAQMQPMVLAAPVQVLGGLALLAIVPASFVAVWRDRAAELLAALPGLG